MKTLLFISFVLIAACNQTLDQSGEHSANRRPVILDAYGVHVDADSIPIKTVAAGKPKITAATKPSIIEANSNVHFLSSEIPSHKINPENVTIHTPGTGNFSLPKEYAVRQKVVLAGSPDVVVAKAMISKDQNPGNFSHFKITQGLPANVIRDIIEDPYGNLWLGTTLGFCRYDGKYFSNFTSADGLPSDDITAMCLDDKGNFWIGTYNGELIHYDGKYFTWYDLPDTSLNLTYVNKIIQDQKGNIWMSKGNESIKFNGETFMILSAENGLPGTTINDLLEDHDGHIWFATDQGFSCYDGSRFINFNTHVMEENKCLCEEWDNILALRLGHENNLWASSARSLTRYSGKSLSSGEGSYIRFTEQDGLPNSLVSLYQSSDQQLWIGTFRSGVVKYNGRSFSILDEKSGLAGNSVTDILEDKTGNIWIGTHSGLVRYDGDLFNHYTDKDGLVGNTAQSIFSDSKGRIWIGTIEKGLSCYDGKYFYNYSSGTGIPSNDVKSIAEDSKGNIWIGTWGMGICKFDGNFFSSYTEAEGLSSNKIYTVAVDKQDNLWIAGTNGFSKLNSSETTFSHFQIGSESSSLARAIHVDVHHTIWIGTDEDGIYSVDSSGIMKFGPGHGFPLEAYAVLKDHNGFLWFCSGYPVSLLTCFDGKRTITFNLSDLHYSTTWAIAEDNHGDLWFGTNGTGVLKLDYKNFENYHDKIISDYASNDSTVQSDYSHLFRNYDYENGFLGINIWHNSICKDLNGNLWWGSADRVSTFNPSEIRPDTIAPSMQILDVKLFNERIDWPEVKNGQKRILNNGIHLGKIKFDSTKAFYNLPLKLSLPYNNNNVALEFIGINLKSRNKVLYQYQLEGLEENWSAPTEDNEVNYGTLRPANYTFRVKAMNTDGYWSEPVDYSFNIRPPWWATWWFRASMIIVFVSGTILFIRTRTSSLRRQKLVLENTVEERTLDLRKQKEIAEEQRMRAEHSEQIKQQFLANMSHEIRTPMNAIIGMTELISASPLNDKQRNYIEAVKKSSNNLLHIINDILDLSKIEAGKIELELIHFSIRELVQHLKDMLQERARNKGLQFLTTIEPNIPEVLMGDPNRLTQVLVNLVNNAIKFTEKGSVWLELAREGVDDVKFSIVDTGIGIPADKLDSIFESFSQAHVSDSRKYGGTGLGLTISKQFIELMGGKLHVESKVNSGSTFSFTLHLQEGSAEKLLQQSYSEELDGSVLDGLRILLVDDSIDNRMVAHDLLLSKANVIIEEATNGKEAIDLLCQHDYDIVLMDVQMPVMDGYQATREVRSLQSTVRNHTIPIIALTASVIRSDLDKCRACGMNDYVPKPFNLSQLISTIARLTGRDVKSNGKNHSSSVNISTDKTGIIDLSFLREFCSGDTAQMKKYIRMVLDEVPVLIQKLNAANAENQYAEIARHVHGFRMKLAMMGMNEATDLASEIEAHCRQTNVDPGIHGQVEKLIALIEDGRKQLGELTLVDA